MIKQYTLKPTVREVLKANNIRIDTHDQFVPDLDSKVKDKMVITVIRAFPITIVADGQSHGITSIPIKVEQALQEAKVALGAKDLVSAKLDDLTYEGQVIKVTRVEEKIIDITNSIPFSREIINDDKIEVGLTRTISRGSPGRTRETVKVTYHDEVEAKREILSTQVIRQPVNEVIARGTITSVSRGGLRLDIQRAFMAMATAYTYTGRNTATGKRPAVGLVAVDPAVIPMGSRLYIEGYGFATAADRGSSIKGNKVDLFMESKAECRKWGRRTVKVYLLK